MFKTMINKIKSIIIKPNITIIISMCLLSACSEEQAVVEQPLRPVRSIQVETTGTAQKLTFAGTTRAGLESRLSFKVNGTLKDKYIKVGDKVKKGQLLLALDPKDYNVKLQQIQANLASAKAAERNALSNYERVRLLYENNNAALNDLESARANADSAKASVNVASKELESSRNQLQYTKLYSPADCAVASLDVDINENIGAAKQVAQLNCGNEPEVVITIPEIYISQIKVGDITTVTFDARAGVSYEAIITEVSVSSIAGSAFPVTVKLNQQDNAIRAGMAAEVSLLLANGKKKNAIYIPSNAVGEDRQGRFVWIVENTEKAGVGIIKRRNVVIGQLTARGLEISNGLSNSEYVATAGTTFLSENLKVKFNNDTQVIEPSSH